MPCHFSQICPSCWELNILEYWHDNVQLCFYFFWLHSVLLSYCLWNNVFYVLYIGVRLLIPLITPSVIVPVLLSLPTGKTVSLHICPDNILKSFVTWSKLLPCLCWKATPEIGLLISIPFFFFPSWLHLFQAAIAQLYCPNIHHESLAFRGH